MTDIALQRVDLLGLPLNPEVSVDTVCSLLREKGSARLITFINLNSCLLAKKQPEYLETLRRMTLSLADTPEIAWACRWLTGVSCSRVSFGAESLIGPLFKTAVAEHASFMLVGGEPGVEDQMQFKLQSRYPGLKILGTIHGYDEFGPKVAEVLARSPDAVLVDMKGVRQEAFLLALADAGYRGMAIACKGYFEQYLAGDGYYPQWVERWKFHSIWQIYKAPSHSWKSHWDDYVFFITQAGKELVVKYTGRLRRRV